MPQMIEWALTPSGTPGRRTMASGATPACGAPLRSRAVRARSATCQARKPVGRGAAAGSPDAVLAAERFRIIIMVKTPDVSKLQAADGVSRPQHADAQGAVLFAQLYLDAEDVEEHLRRQAAARLAGGV